MSYTYLSPPPKIPKCGGCATAPLHNPPLGLAILTKGTLLLWFPCNESVVENGDPCVSPSNTTTFHIKTDFFLLPLGCATTCFHRLHLCNRVQPCATTMLRAMRAVLQKMKNPFNASTFGQCTTNHTWHKQIRIVHHWNHKSSPQWNPISRSPCRTAGVKRAHDALV